MATTGAPDEDQDNPSTVGSFSEIPMVLNYDEDQTRTTNLKPPPVAAKPPAICKEGVDPQDLILEV